MSIDALTEQFVRINSLFESMHGECISLGGTTPLTTGEIHLIEAIGKHPDANVTDLAKVLGNTKGAVSQMAAKLEKKGLICKTRRADNDKDIILTLKEDGWFVFKEHEKLHADLYAELEQYANELEQAKVLMDVVEKHLNIYKERLY